jgi:hypothetical protein
MNSTQRMIEAERERIREREEAQRTNLIQGMILVPVIFLGWYPIVWILSKFFK